MKLCECGCGTVIPDGTRFAKGHWLKMKENQKSVSAKKSIVVSEETKQKQRDYHKNNPWTDEMKAKISAANKGKQYRLGKKQSEYQKETMRLLRTGTKSTEETKKKISISHGGTGISIIELKCENCENKFETRYSRRDAKFCSLSCRCIYFNKKYPPATRNYPVKNMTNDEKIKMYARPGKLNGMYGKPVPKNAGRGHQGVRADIGHFVRSCWEANYARILKYENTPYVYEPQMFRLTLDNGVETNYTPDFLINSNEYIEIKGYLDEIHAKKIDAFRLANPDKKLILIETEQYHDLLKKYKGLVDFEDYTKPRIVKEGV